MGRKPVLTLQHPQRGASKGNLLLPGSGAKDEPVVSLLVAGTWWKGCDTQWSHNATANGSPAPPQGDVRAWRGAGLGAGWWVLV